MQEAIFLKTYSVFTSKNHSLIVHPFYLFVKSKTANYVSR
jgi:hypothetical protein